MKLLISVFLAVSLISVSVLGLVLMNHELLGHGGCVASISAKTMPCSEKADLINYINLHGDFLKKFFAPVFASLILLLAGLVLIIFLKPEDRAGLILRSCGFKPSYSDFFEKIRFLANKDFLSWLSFSQSVYPASLQFA